MALSFLVAPALLASLGLRQARLPLRRGHVAALGVVGLAGSAVVWLSCAVVEPMHLLLEHGGAAVLGVVVVAAVAHAVLRRPRPLASF
jgi:hypothetical protein